MDIKKFFIFLLIILSNTVFGQQSLNKYKYVIVPVKYDFLSTNDQYQVNSLTKFLFKKEGFKTIFDNLAKPTDLSNNPCSALTAKVISNSGVFATKLQIELRNCENKVVFTSEVGKSKVKDFKKGYHEALRNAFKSISALNYEYSSNLAKTKGKKLNVEPVEVTEKINPNIEEHRVVDPVAIAVETGTNSTIDQVVEPDVFEAKDAVAAVKDPKELETSIETPEVASQTTDIIKSGENVLYAQANALGYQLVDSTPRVVYVLLKSARENVYFLRHKKGIVYKENGQWIAEYYDLDTLVRKEILIKF